MVTDLSGQCRIEATNWISFDIRPRELARNYQRTVCSTPITWLLEISKVILRLPEDSFTAYGYETSS